MQKGCILYSKLFKKEEFENETVQKTSGFGSGYHLPEYYCYLGLEVHKRECRQEQRSPCRPEPWRVGQRMAVMLLPSNLQKKENILSDFCCSACFGCFLPGAAVHRAYS